MFFARLCLAAIFILSGVNKFMNFDQTAAYMASKGMTMIPLFLFGAASIQILGGLSLVLGYRTRVGAALLILFLIPATYIFHDFWNVTGADRVALQVEFLKNLAILGGLLYVLSTGPGRCACDSCCCKSKYPDIQPPLDKSSTL
ncbi:MAG: DoxX family protein [Parachlamydiaceae bacterium]|nr:DoxX family protein [Parachlamydiaceae bacterium]